MSSSTEKPADPDARTGQTIFAAQTAIAVLVMIAMFVAPAVPGLWSATISRVLVAVAALTTSFVLSFFSNSAWGWAAVIAVATCVSGTVLMLLEA